MAKVDQTVPRPFEAKFDENRNEWGVRQGERWRYATSLCIQVFVLSDGLKGYLTGVGVVRSLKRGEIVITA